MVGFSDSKILEGIKANNHEIFEFVFLLYYESLCIYAFTILKNKDIAEEIVQDFFVKFWENRHALNIHTTFKAYIYRSIHNKCINYLQHESVHRKFTTDVQETTLEMVSPLSADYPIANLLKQELSEKIKQALDKLPLQCREVFMLVRMDNLSYAEAAEKLNISINTVKTQLHRAVIKLRESLADYFPE